MSLSDKWSGFYPVDLGILGLYEAKEAHVHSWSFWKGAWAVVGSIGLGGWMEVERPGRRESTVPVQVLEGSTWALSGGARFQRHFGSRGNRICSQVNVEAWSRRSWERMLSAFLAWVTQWIMVNWHKIQKRRDRFWASWVQGICDIQVGIGWEFGMEVRVGEAWKLRLKE